MDKLLAALRRAVRAGRGMGGAALGVAVIAGAIWLGARQGREQGSAGFDNPASAQAPSTPPPPFQSDQDQVKGLGDRAAFAHSCGTCHTLRAAGVTGGIGPDLDKVGRRLTFAVVRDQIRTGSLDTAMPANLLVGRDADRVARYVARVAR